MAKVTELVRALAQPIAAEKAGQLQHFFTLMRYHPRENGRQGEYAGVSALT